MLKTVVREHHWSPAEFAGLFIDAEDPYGLEYWYDDVIHCIEEMNAKTKTK